ncbi:MAG: hypothetical protein BroJett007_02440 [Chloroflexota bacterium]|nr:MAG: hypothetical protein BroJett007_02440 [Chloroflexota bacterium]
MAWNAERWRDEVAALFTLNRVEVDGYRYTRPAPSTYEHQWLWDSCFHAIILRHIDPEMAWDELRAISARPLVSGSDAGMLPHMQYWRGGGEGLWGVDSHSIITQPPLIAIAAQLVWQIAPDEQVLRTIYPTVAAFHTWFARRRDVEGDGLVCLIHPWESGWDASPRWDAPMGLSVLPSDDEARSARLALAATLQERDTDPRTARAEGRFCVIPADFNAVRIADLDALTWMAGQIGSSADAARWAAEARMSRDAFRRRLIRDGLPVDLDVTRGEVLAVETAGQFVTLFGGVLEQSEAEAIAARLEHVEWSPRWRVPTSPVNQPQYAGDRYWRGNVWVNVNWMIWAGLRRYGLIEQADALALQTAELVETEGWHEYFDPMTGAGHGSHPHSWTALVLDMLAVSAGSLG